IDISSDSIHALRTPGPELWADVIDDFDPAAMKRSSEPQIELGPINQDHSIRLLFNGRGLQISKRTHEPVEDLTNFDDSHDCERVGVHNSFNSRSSHQWTGRTKE